MEQRLTIDLSARDSVYRFVVSSHERVRRLPNHTNCLFSQPIWIAPRVSSLRGHYTKDLQRHVMRKPHPRSADFAPFRPPPERQARELQKRGIFPAHLRKAYDRG